MWVCLKKGSENMVLVVLLQVGAKGLTVYSLVPCQAVLDNSPDKMEKLVEDGHPVDLRDQHSLTPLHLACCRSRG